MKGCGKRRLLLCLLALFLLISCRAQVQRPAASGGIRLYFLDERNDTGSALASEPYTGGRAPTVRILLTTLLGGPTQEGLVSPFPAQTSLRGWSVEDGLLTLDLSEHYGDLSGIDLTLADYCIALTLCQLEEVDRVRITVAGTALAYRGHDILTPSEAVLDGLVSFVGEEGPGEELANVQSPAESLADGSGLAEKSSGAS